MAHRALQRQTAVVTPVAYSEGDPKMTSAPPGADFNRPRLGTSCSSTITLRYDGSGPMGDVPQKQLLQRSLGCRCSNIGSMLIFFLEVAEPGTVQRTGFRDTARLLIHIN